jgi:hypothetical protein
MSGIGDTRTSVIVVGLAQRNQCQIQIGLQLLRKNRTHNSSCLYHFRDDDHAQVFVVFPHRQQEIHDRLSAIEHRVNKDDRLLAFEITFELATLLEILLPMGMREGSRLHCLTDTKCHGLTTPHQRDD